ncbi:MAG: GH3 auxin-responsive promoter family protein [Deltaproteobacteria bacterium]|nr:GH3 auxin-responsive promoter family protein [Deltaproteobacteria bacterium]
MDPRVTMWRLSQWGVKAALDSACRDLAAAQERTLLRLVKQHRNTEFGREHGYASVRSVDDFLQRVTMEGYDFFSSRIDRMLHGERNVLVPAPVRFWSATAGTTGWRKVFPITDQRMEELLAGMSVWFDATWRDHASVLDGEVIHFVAPARVDLATDGTPIGNMSGYTFRRVPTVVQRRYGAPWEAFEVRDPGTRAYVVARVALARPVRWLFAISSHVLHQVIEVLRTRADDLLRDLRDGTLGVEVPSEIRRALAPWLRPHPDAAARIAQRAQSAGGLTPRAAWPDLRLLSCWTHGGGAAFLPEVTAAIPGAPVRGFMYAASEGWFSLPLEDGDAPGVLNVLHDFYEFIPVDDNGEARGAPVLAHELQDGGRYTMVVTNATGLARYRMDDVVAVEGFRGRAPRIRYLHKLGGALNVHRDATTEIHARAAVEHVQGSLGRPLGRWALALSPLRGPAGVKRYTFLVERAAEGGPSDAELARALDGALRASNPGYRRALEGGRAAALTVSRVAPGGFAQVQAERARQGHAGDHVKPLALIREAAVRDLFHVTQETGP